MLTDSAIKKLKSEDKAYFVGDGNCLYICVYPSGRKTWVLRSRRKRAKKKTIGEWPLMNVVSARAALEKELLSLATLDTRVTLAELAEDYLDHKARDILSTRRVMALETWLRLYIAPDLGEVPVCELTPPQILTVARRLEAQGLHETAHRVVSFIGRICRYGCAAGVTSSDPAAVLRGALVPTRVTHRAALVTPSDVGALLRGIAGIKSLRLRLALQMIAYVFVRPGELRGACWAEIDMDRALWELPAERMKMRQPHLVPLARQVLELLDCVRGMGWESEYVFPSPRTMLSPMSDVTLLAGLRRLGYEPGEISVHGFRATASTLLNEAQWPSDLIELQLAHTERNSSRAPYNRALHLDARRSMMQWWADYLDALRDNRPEPDMPN